MTAHDEQCERLPDFYICHCAKRERLSRGLTKLPALVVEYPTCGGCGHAVYSDGETLACDRCHVSWPTNAGDGDTADHFTDDYDDYDDQHQTLAQMREAWINRKAVTSA